MNESGAASASILVVDDNPANLRLLTDMLSAASYAVRVAINGPVAIKSATARLPDLILLDVNMPQMDGIQVCQRLKADERTRAVPVIFVSALTDASVKVSGFKAGAVDYVTKPFAAEEVLARVRTHLTLNALQQRLEREVDERTRELTEEIAERRRAEERLRRSEAQFRAFFEKNSSVMLLIDPQTGRIEAANGAASRYYGYSPERLLEMTIDQINTLSREMIARERERALRERNNYFQFRHRLASGEIRDVEVYSTPIEEQDRTLLFSLIHDITERKQARMRLEASERRFRQLVESSPLPMLVVDDTPQSRVQLMNRRFTELFGYSPEQVRDVNGWWPLAYPDPQFRREIRERWEQALERMRETGAETIEPVAGEVTCADGGRRFVEMVMTRIGNQGLLVFHDLTERKRVQDELARHRDLLAGQVAARTAELRASNEALRETQYTVDKAAVPIFWIEPDSARFLYVNDRVCQVLGYSRERMLTLSVPDIDPEFPVDRWPEHVEELRQGGSLTFETRHRRRDGSVFPVEVTVYLSDFRGEERMVSFAMDISQRKTAEEEILRAKEAAEAASQAKTVFLANMSHELRTPMNAILGFAQLMHRDPALTASQRDNLSAISRSGQHLLELINDILEISRIETGRGEALNHPFDLWELLTGIEETIRLRAQTKGLGFALRRDPRVPCHVRGDGHKLRQVLLNLLDNALKFTDRGRVDLEVVTEDLDGDRARLGFAVNDTGIGIPAEELEHIFKPFAQGRVSEQRGEGTGLGLSICREFVQLLGGELSVRSQPGQGSCFRFGIGLTVAAADEVARPGPERRVVGLEPDQPSYRLLVVEDKVDNRRLLRTLLEHVDFQVREAVNGVEAVEMFRSWHPHLIWMDMRMPVMDGYEATRRIKATPAGKQTPIVALTASALEEQRAKVLAAGCDAHVGKPFKEREIFDCLEHVLGVRFRYQTPPADAVTGAARGLALAAEELALLPAELCARLRQAAQDLDSQALEALNAEIARYSAPLAEAVKALVDDFRFDVIMDAMPEP